MYECCTSKCVPALLTSMRHLHDTFTVLIPVFALIDSAHTRSLKCDHNLNLWSPLQGGGLVFVIFPDTPPEAEIFVVFRGSMERHEVPIARDHDSPMVLQAVIPGLWDIRTYMMMCCEQNGSRFAHITLCSMLDVLLCKVYIMYVAYWPPTTHTHAHMHAHTHTHSPQATWSCRPIGLLPGRQWRTEVPLLDQVLLHCGGEAVPACSRAPGPRARGDGESPPVQPVAAPDDCGGIAGVWRFSEGGVWGSWATAGLDAGRLQWRHCHKWRRWELHVYNIGVHSQLTDSGLCCGVTPSPVLILSTKCMAILHIYSAGAGEEHWAGIEQDCVQIICQNWKWDGQDLILSPFFHISILPVQRTVVHCCANTGIIFPTCMYYCRRMRELQYQSKKTHRNYNTQLQHYTTVSVANLHLLRTVVTT